MTIVLELLVAASVMTVGSAPAGTEAFLAKYISCAHTMATVYDIDNCAAFDTAMDVALAAAETEVRQRATARDAQRSPRSGDDPTLASRLATERAAWDHYVEVACDHYTVRDHWGTDGQRILAPICGMQLDTYRLRALQTLIKNLR